MSQAMSIRRGDTYNTELSSLFRELAWLSAPVAAIQAWQSNEDDDLFGLVVG